MKTHPGLTIAQGLALFHTVESPGGNHLELAQAVLPRVHQHTHRSKPTDGASRAVLKTITVDGSYVNVGSDIIGKKKLVESLSVTRLDDGRYLLLWWE